jgi:hypothetical protein
MRTSSGIPDQTPHLKDKDMRKDSFIVFSMMVLAVVLTMGVSAAVADPIIGTWKLNLAKSKLSAMLIATLNSLGFQVVVIAWYSYSQLSRNISYKVR